jgi:hypothetical protein
MGKAHLLRESAMKSLPFALAVLLAATPSLAATTPGAPGIPMSDVTGGKDLTCSTFLKLSGEAATKVLYFVNGYAAGIADQLAAGAQSGTNTGTSATATNGATASGSAGNGATKAASSPVASSPALNGMSMDQLRAVCRASPDSKVLAVMPGGEPISASGTLTSNSAAGAAGTTGTNGASGTAGAGAASGAGGAATGNAPASGGGANTGATFGMGTSGTATTAGSAGAGTTGAPANANPVVPTPPTGGTTTDPNTGLVHVTPPSGGTTGTTPTTTTP